jgi:hypothetical protein
MANGTLKVENIQTSSGSGTITLGQSGETLSLGSGVTSQFNQPAFEAQLGALQNISDATVTKIEFGVENLDTDNCYDNTTNYRFTPTVAGKYFVYLNMNLNSSVNNTCQQAFTYIYKNGSQEHSNGSSMQGSPGTRNDATLCCILDMNGSTDYVEAFGYVDNSSGTPRIGSSGGSTFFGAYRIGA